MLNKQICTACKTGKCLVLCSVCLFTILTIYSIAVPVIRPNADFLIELFLISIYLIIICLIGYYQMKSRFKAAKSGFTDNLTGLYSHGYFQKTLDEQIVEAEKNNKSISLLFIDIDHFKCFNDLYGHQEGDEVLKLIGSKISSYTNPSCFASRYDGAKFTILMCETTEDESVILAEKLRQNIEGTFANKYTGVKNITVSIGVSCFPTKANDKNQLIKYADDALYIAKKFHRNKVELYKSVLEELKDNIDNDDVEIISSIKTAISIINSKDKYTSRHVERVVKYCGLIADALKLSTYEKKTLKYGAYLHDIGKINIPQEVLNKQMSLTDEEWTLLKLHPTHGVDMITPIKSLSDTIPIIQYHHERFDGKGYPENLKGENIPYLARILTVADSFDAMTSTRPYGAVKTYDEAIEELLACSASQFDPKIVETFVEILRTKKVFL